jgi:hypothetical protein
MHRPLTAGGAGIRGTEFANADGTVFKGITEILMEGGDDCMFEGKRMPKECSKARRRVLGNPSEHECLRGRRCCQANALRWRPDFAGQPCKLQEVCALMGVMFIMLMICHPECNPIEGFWNGNKRYTRSTCDYTMVGLKVEVPKAFLATTIYWVRKAFQRSDRYLAMYMMEVAAMPFALREFMVKCWSRHRDTPKKIDDLITMAFDLLQKKKEDLLARMKTKNIKVEKLQKVASLLSDIDMTFKDTAADKMDEGLTAIQARVKAAKEAECRQMEKLKKVLPMAVVLVNSPTSLAESLKRFG